MISVIGAGPSGCYAAYLLAKTGKPVQIFEEHKEIGHPIQCTGLVTSSIKDIIDLKQDIIINEIDKVRIFSKHEELELKLKNKNLIIDRKKFDNYLADLAVSKGVKIFLNYKFIDKKNNLLKLKYNNEKETIVKTDHLIGADGPLSKVAGSINPKKETKLMTGIQAVVKLKNENHIEFYPSIGTFAWIVPENKEICRIGVASYKNPREEFQKFLKTKNIEQKDITDTQGGLIPIYNPRLKTDKNNTYLLGDAAAQVKATTGGGIIQGLKAAQAMTKSIIEGKDYEKEWRRSIHKDLLLHLRMRKIMDRFKDKDWDLLIRLFKKPKTKSIIENFDRDYPSKFMVKLALTEPRLIYFSRFLL